MQNRRPIPLKIAKFGSPPAVAHGKMSAYFAEDSFLSAGPGIDSMKTGGGRVLCAHFADSASCSLGQKKDLLNGSIHQAKAVLTFRGVEDILGVKMG